MLKESLLTQGEAAKLLRISPRTLERYRVDGTGPTYMKAGQRVLYRPADILTWLESRTYRSTSEMKAAG